MATDDCKEFLERTTGVPAARWKRRSKSKEGGSTVRVFENTLSGSTATVVDDGRGTLALLGSGGAVPGVPSAAPGGFVPVGYYQVDDWQFTLVLKDFWDGFHGIDDSGSEEPFVPDGFCALAEACYEFDGDVVDGRAALDAAGWVEAKLN